MLKLLRKKGVSKKIIWFVVIIIIISFGFLGTAYLITDNVSAKQAGKLYGRKVSLSDFEKAYQDVRIQAIIRYGDNFNKIRDYLNLENSAWERLILLHQAKKQKIKIANKDVILAIEQYPFFQRDGQFDQALYNNILKYVFRIEARTFEESTRDNLKLNHLFDIVTASVIVNEKQVIEAFKNHNEKMQISCALITPESFEKNISVTEQDIQTYYEDHKDEFLAPETINVQYITLALDNPDKPADQASPKNQADAIYQQLLINPDMTVIAAEHNLTVKETGFFSLNQPILKLGWSYDLLNKIFQLETGEVNEPFQTNDSIHIVQLKSKKQVHVPTLDQAKDQIRQTVIRYAARQIAKNKAEEYRTLIEEGLNKTKIENFPKIAKSLNLEIFQTPIFNRGQYLPKVGISPEFQKTAFSLSEQDKLSSVVETPPGYCILYLDTYIAPEMSKLDKQRDEIARSLSTKAKTKLFDDYLKQLRQKAGLEDDLSKLRQKN